MYSPVRICQPVSPSIRSWLQPCPEKNIQRTIATKKKSEREGIASFPHQVLRTLSSLGEDLRDAIASGGLTSTGLFLPKLHRVEELPTVKRQLETILHARLFKDMHEMCFHRAGSNGQRFCDF